MRPKCSFIYLFDAVISSGDHVDQLLPLAFRRVAELPPLFHFIARQELQLIGDSAVPAKVFLEVQVL